jgi:hypothetical protein
MSAESPSNLLGKLPPWALMFVYLSGGGAIGGLGMNFNHTCPVIPEPSMELALATLQAEESLRDLESMTLSFNLITELLSKCQRATSDE